MPTCKEGIDRIPLGAGIRTCREVGLDISPRTLNGWSSCRRDASDAYLHLHLVGGRYFAIVAAGREYRFHSQEGHIDYFPPGSLEISSGPQPGEFLRVRISREFELDVLREAGAAALMAPKIQFVNKRIERLIRTVRSREHSEVGRAVLSVALVEQVHNLDRSGSGSQSISSLLRKLLVEYMDQHVAAAPSVASLAELIGLSRTSAGTAVKDAVGRSVHQMVIERRIEGASRRLCESEDPVTQIAQDYGFSSHAHFSSVFRKRTGCTPTVYRRMKRTDDQLTRKETP